MHPEPGPGPPTQPGWIWILEKITASLSRRNLIVKLCCPFILLSSRNISESSSSTSISTSIRPSTQPVQPVQPVACGHHLTSHISHLTHPHPPSLTPRGSPTPSPITTRDQCMQASRPDRDTLQASWGVSSSQITRSVVHFGLLCAGDQYCFSLWCACDATTWPVRALTRPVSRSAP